MKPFSLRLLHICVSVAVAMLYAGSLNAQSFKLQTSYAAISVNNKGYITSIKDQKTGKEYCPAGMSSALLSLYKNNQYIYPKKAEYSADKKQIKLAYDNNAEAVVKVDQNQSYIRFELLSLSPRNDVDNVVWGPYKTTISKLIGDLFSVVRNDAFAFGLMGLNDNTTSGPPTEGDMSFMYYYIHTPDAKKYPVPAHLKEGQTFSIGGDGVNDVAFYSQPEEYFRMNYGNGAILEPSFGASVCMHSRDRKKEQMIRFPYYPDNIEGKANSSRYQLVTPADADFIGSAIALYACPDSIGLKTIEKIALNEHLPHPEIDGKWIKDPAAYRPDIAWWGAHDSLISYANALGIQGVQDEGWGEYYPNPSNRWTNRNISFKGSPAMTIPEYGKLAQKNGIRWGLHTLCEFLQPDNNSDVSPMPSDSLAIMQRTVITKDISVEDSIITVADTAYFNEFGGWEGNHTNVLKIGKELIEYNGITRTAPYTFLHVKRGFHNTVKGTYKAGTVIVKLQPNCYRGFAPDINLQDVYADYYGKWLTEGGMDYIDFDGLESCMYQGHGQYSFKRFFRGLFDSYSRNGGSYLRVMGSAIQEGNWHYMSVCNVGGGDHMFSPVQNKWGIEGKDMRYVLESSYFPSTFGIQSLASDWTLYDAENLEAKSIGWNATYMLGLSQDGVEKNISKDAIFSAYKAWQNARAAQVFTKARKERLKSLEYKFHLEQTGAKSFLLYPVKENRFAEVAYTKNGSSTSLQNEFAAQKLDLAIRVHAPKDQMIDGVKIVLPDGTEVAVEKKLSNGDFVISKNNQLYTADKNRNLKEMIPVSSSILLPKGKSTMKVSALHEGDEKVKLELVVTTIGNAEKI